jgi:hypothetical protein
VFGENILRNLRSLSCPVHPPHDALSVLCDTVDLTLPVLYIPPPPAPPCSHELKQMNTQKVGRNACWRFAGVLEQIGEFLMEERENKTSWKELKNAIEIALRGTRAQVVQFQYCVKHYRIPTWRPHKILSQGSTAAGHFDICRVHNSTEIWRSRTIFRCSGLVDQCVASHRACGIVRTDSDIAGVLLQTSLAPQVLILRDAKIHQQF